VTNRYGGLIPSPNTLILFVKKLFHVQDSVSDFIANLNDAIDEATLSKLSFRD
jgi:hypothetical protein